MWRRLLKWLLIVVLVLVALAVAIGVWLWTRVPKDQLATFKPGTLTVSATQSTLQAGPFSVQVGESVSVTRGDAVVWRSAPGVSFLSASRSNVEFPEHLGYFWPQVSRTAVLADQSLTDAVEADGTVVLTGTVSGDDTSADFTMTLRPAESALGIEINVPGVDSVKLTSGVDDGEQLHGLGEQYRPLDLTGTVTPVLVREQGIGRGQQPLTYLADVTQKGAGGTLTNTYAAWPSYVTSSNRALTFADVEASGAFTVADFSVEGQASLEAWSPTISAQAYAADSPKELLAQQASGSKRQKLADWVQKGAVLGLQGGTDRVRKIVKEMQQSGTKISGVWLQDWTGKRVTSFGDRLWWTWQLDRQRYPGWAQMVRDFNDEGIEVLTYINPWLVDPQAKGDTSIRDLFSEAVQKGYVVQKPEGSPYMMDQNGFDAVLVDFTNPAARTWYSDIIAKDVLGAGAVGFMADFGEALPYDAKLHDGDPKIVHNLYPQLWASVVREGCDKAGQPECLAFMRSAFLGSEQQVPMMWAGDQMVDFAHQDGLASAVYSMQAGGLSGFPLWHSDIGGYTSINAVVKNYVRPPDLNARWAQMQAFGVMMRTHEGNRPAQNQQVYDTPETRAQFAEATKIYAALYDYRKTVIDEATATGVPAVRPVWMVYPGTYADLQFFLGEHLMVAPVVEQGATSVDVTFPPGEWVHVLTGETYSGQATVPAPLDTPAAFVRSGDPVGQGIVDALASP